MEQKSYFKYDQEEVSFKSRNGLQAYIDFRKENDVITEPLAAMVKVVGYDIQSNLDRTLAENEGVDFGSSFRNVITQTNPFVVCLPVDFKPVAFPLRDIALTDLENRAEIYGEMLERMGDNPRKGVSVWSADYKASVFSAALCNHMKPIKVLIRDNKVTAMKSEIYRFMAEKDLIEGLETTLKADFPDMEFSIAKASHEFLSAEWFLNSPEEGALKLFLEKNGKKIDGDLRSVISFSTSNTGSSMVTAQVRYMINGIYAPVGDPIKVKHVMQNKPEDFFEKLKGVGAILKDGEDAVENLGNTDISYPDQTFINILKTLKESSAFSKKAVDDKAQVLKAQYGHGCMAIDVYLALSDFVEQWAMDKPVDKVISVRESVARTLYYDWSKFDRPED